MIVASEVHFKETSPSVTIPLFGMTGVDFEDIEGIMPSKISWTRTFLVVQRLRCFASSAEDMGLIPGWGTKIPCAAQYGQ